MSNEDNEDVDYDAELTYAATLISRGGKCGVVYPRLLFAVTNQRSHDYMHMKVLRLLRSG
jgi:hypothetical protein